jgi:hypothetical protein
MTDAQKSIIELKDLVKGIDESYKGTKKIFFEITNIYFHYIMQHISKDEVYKN